MTFPRAEPVQSVQTKAADKVPGRFALWNHYRTTNQRPAINGVLTSIRLFLHFIWVLLRNPSAEPEEEAAELFSRKILQFSKL